MWLTSVTVWLFSREGVAKSPCKCGSGGGIYKGFRELEDYLDPLHLSDHNAVFHLCCHLCSAYEEKAFRHGLLYGAHLMAELFMHKQE